MFIIAVPLIKLFAWGEGESRVATIECVCLLLQYLLQSCSRGGIECVLQSVCVYYCSTYYKLFAWGGEVEDMCYERRRAEACVD